jgi:hypothetical protein
MYAAVVAKTNDYATMRTWIYEVIADANGQYHGWWPVPPSQVAIAFSAYGVVSYDGTWIEEPQAGLPSHAPRVIAAPNPAFGHTRFLLLDLPQSASAQIRVYDVAGRLVRILTEESPRAGVDIWPWDGRTASGDRVPGGVYFYQLEVNGEQIGKHKLVITR